ncbi:hypothetical protein [Micromonospora zhanjiangensis]|uniref:Uncharacterized protein n=1 Tax=Micromonospora zhanjiangensis TaxID=1522057 RepID=A0ABV8KNE1_9ACTN
MLLRVALTVLVGLVPGFLIGLFAFRVKSRWCPRCGATTHTLIRTTRR